jgi:phosphoserine aminotransferase
MRVRNFCAGPATIPDPVLEEVKSELLDWGSSGMSIMEMSHRSSIFNEVAFNAKNDFIELLKVPQDYDVLFLQGGATHQFSMVPMNFSSINQSADYLLSGTWSKLAISEASKLSNINIVASSEENNFSHVPDIKLWNLDSKAKYFHYAPNETIQGVALHKAPEINSSIVADMSSVILSEPIDISKFSLIYAGAQKNIGPAGLTMVIINKEMFEKENNNIPDILRYSKHSESNSMLNTPPTFAWYLAGKIFKWLKKEGGLDAMKVRNNLKAKTLYSFLDNSSFFSNSIKTENRSIMNVTFQLYSKELDSLFLEQAEERGLMNLKGHRSLGGMRASIYNAMPIEGVHDLIEFMKEFEAKNG